MNSDADPSTQELKEAGFHHRRHHPGHRRPSPLDCPSRLVRDPNSHMIRELAVRVAALGLLSGVVAFVLVFFTNKGLRASGIGGCSDCNADWCPCWEKEQERRHASQRCREADDR
jgi:hypothetical protein